MKENTKKVSRTNKENYRQIQSKWTLPQEIYKIAIGYVKAYKLFDKIIIEAKEGKVSLNTELAAVNAATASIYKEIIEDTLDEYVIKEYQSAVWENIVENVPLDYVSLKANASKRTIQRWKQKFIWGIAENLGINFGNLGRFVETIKVSEKELEKMFGEKRGEKDE